MEALVEQEPEVEDEVHFRFDTDRISGTVINKSESDKDEFDWKIIIEDENGNEYELHRRVSDFDSMDKRYNRLMDNRERDAELRVYEPVEVTITRDESDTTLDLDADVETVNGVGQSVADSLAETIGEQLCRQFLLYDSEYSHPTHPDYSMTTVDEELQKGHTYDGYEFGIRFLDD